MPRAVVIDRFLRLVMGGFQQARRLIWSVTRPRTFGAHAVAITPRGRIVLVKLRYAPGWRLPGGGRKPSEDAETAVLRELREEIGMETCGAVQLAAELQESSDFKRDTAFLFIVRDVNYRPRWSLEVEAVTEAEQERLPPDTSPQTRRWLEAVGPFL